MTKAKFTNITLAGILMSVALSAGAIAASPSDSTPVVSSTQSKATAATSDSSQAKTTHKKHKKHKKSASAAGAPSSGTAAK